MAIKPQPLSKEFAITNPDGTPTDYFIRWAQERQLSIGENVPDTRQVLAGPGLSGGGNLASDVTLNLDAVLDDLNDVDTTTTPPTDGQVLKYIAADSLWKPGVGGAGGPAEGVRLTRVANSGAVGNAVEYTVSWTAIVTEDIATMWDISNPTQIIIPSSGWYNLGFTAFDSDSTRARIGQARIKVNGVVVEEARGYMPASFAQLAYSVSSEVKLNAGDIVTFTLVTSHAPAASQSYANSACYVVKSGGSGNGERILIEGKDLTGLSTYTFSGIPSGYNHLKLILTGRSSFAGVSVPAAVRLNGLATAVYSTQRQYAINGVNTADTSVGATSYLFIGEIAGTTTPAGGITNWDVDFFNYSSTIFRKNGQFRSRQPGSTVNSTAFTVHGQLEFNDLNPISSLSLTLNSGAFIAGSKAWLYVSE